MTMLESKDSRSTLVEEPAHRRNGTSHPLPPTPGIPPSPFSISFDPNNATPLTPAQGVPLASTARHPSSAVIAAQEAWRTSLTTSLNALASQFSTASLALAALPTPDRESPAGSTALAVLEQAQSQLKEEIDALREQVEYLRTRTPKEKEREHAGVLPVAETYELRIEAVEKKVDELGEALRLDQQRLYARLLNSTVMTNKVKLTPLVMANGKTPQNFPVTKGEFEHLTKERYELLLKSYGQPDKGDTAAKRQALREFIGLSPANN